MNRKAIIIGATGLVGKELVKQLSSLYRRVIVVARRPPHFMSSNMRFYQLNDFDNLAEVFENIDIGADTDAFSCLGTTKKEAGSEETFRKVDFDYNLNFANICQKKGVKNFFLLSSLGADSNSRFFYNQVKGELEQAIQSLGFYYVFIFRPSLLLGKRKGRLLENLSQRAFSIISPIVPESVSSHPITTLRVAMAMTVVAHKLYQQVKYDQRATYSGLTIVSNKEMLLLTKVAYN